MTENNSYGSPKFRLECCYCRKSFTAHRLENGRAGCPHCGGEALVMLHTCPDCFGLLKDKVPIDRKPIPYKCPVCEGTGKADKIPCRPCGGTGVIWYK